MKKFKVINILDLLDILGEEGLRHYLLEFKCPLNLEIEQFVLDNAIEFAKKKISITYLVINSNDDMAAIFTLTHKAVEISNSGLSNSRRKKIGRYADLNTESDRFVVSAYLVAQFGKNYAINDGNSISGNELMELTFEILQKVQREIGGGIVYLECEDNPKLLRFYQNEENRFAIFDERYSKEDNTKYIQLYAIV
jgi:hypothetical protein